MELKGKMLSNGSCCIQQLSRTRSEMVSYYRFLQNEKVNESSLLTQCLLDKSSLCNEEELLVIGDTSQFNMNHVKGRLKEFSGFGVLNDNDSLGFYLHGNIVLSGQKSVLGVSDILLYKREKAERKKTKTHHRDSLKLEEKESYRWWLGAQRSTAYLGNPKRLTFVYDREGDIYEVIDKIESQGSKYIIRNQHNRKILTEQKEQKRLKQLLESIPSSGFYKIDVPIDDRGNTTRKATLEIRYAPIDLMSPTHYTYNLDCSPTRACYVLQVKESETIGTPVCWTIFTNHPIKNKQDALWVIDKYRTRWAIEEVFRGMKNKGLQMDSSELRTSKALRKLAIMTFDISTTALKLKQARDGQTKDKIEEVFNLEQQECLVHLCKKLEGNTDKLSNPFSPEKLAWAAWVIARLGGWKGYQSQRPPGVITMKMGLQKFFDIFWGWKLNSG